MALEIGEEVTGLKCLIRRFSDLEKVIQAVPPQAQVTKRGAVILPTRKGFKRPIQIALSHEVLETARHIGGIGNRVEVLAWPSPQDVLCLYDRPSTGGAVDQVTNKVLAVLRQSYPVPDMYGTGRTLGVIRDLLESRGLHTY